ncbi:MAG: hypothetical protein GY730_05580 [bacterium]|nr:hypothetical protein [bacterium]
MPRDKKIRISFEVADDGMQAIIGYFFYVIACKSASKNKLIKENLPKDQIPVTLEWVRFYDQQNFMDNMGSCFKYYHARVCMVSVISSFEGALKNIIARLNEREHISNTAKKRLQHYKKKLEWAFDLVADSTYGTKTMKARIPELCLQVDHARRIRNLWMHNNGLLNKWYADDSININGHLPIIVPSYREYEKSPQKALPILLKPERFLIICLNHIELLHQRCVSSKLSPFPKKISQLHRKISS